jgi:serine/threonine-protein kinase
VSGDHPDPAPADLSGVDAACDAFEAAWQAGRRPRPEDALAGAAGATRSALLRELLLIDLTYRLRAGERPAVAEYLARFPGDDDIVRAAFAAAAPGEEPTPHAVAAENLLLGLLALQNNFVSRERLLAAFAVWVADKASPLGRVLCDQGALDPSRLALLEALVREHLKIHGDDPGQSLAALSSLGSVRDDLDRAADPAVRSCLSVVATLAPAGDSASGSTTAEFSGLRRAGDRFRVLRFHRQGGLGQVYVARDQELGRDVALKEIRPDMDAGAMRSRFVLEAEINGGLEHPGIVPVYSLGSYDDGRPFYAMRFVEGDSLDEAIKAYHAARRFDPAGVEFRKLLGRFVDVCEAIAYAHSKGVLHRDLKPHNVMLGRYGETLLIDWGLAKATGRREPSGPTAAVEATLVPPSGSSHEPTVGVLGSPNYMSPEQAAGRVDALGPATDVYGLGAVLYSLLTGKPPVSGPSRDEVLDRVRRGQVVPPRQVNRRVPAALEAVCLKALRTQPADRYSTARALADDVERWLADESVTARRDPLFTRSWRWLRKHRTLATTAAAIILVALAATVIAYRREARHSADLAASVVRERQRFHLAREAIQSFTDGVQDDEALRNPAFERLRARLLRRSQQFYRKLEGLLKGQTDRDSLQALAAAYFDLGGLTAMIDNKSEALASHELARTIRKRLVDTNPGVAEFRRDLATSDSETGNLLHQTGRTSEALASYERARAAFRQLADTHPNLAHVRIGLAETHNRLGLLLTQTGQTSAALASYEEALATFQKLADDNPEVVDHPRGLANVHHNVGVLLSESGKPQEALAAYGRALAVREKLADDDPENTAVQNDLAASRNSIGNVLGATGKPSEALASYRRALAIWQKLAGDNPEATDLQSNLAWGHSNVGALLSKTGALPEALKSYEKALAIRQKLADDNPTATKHRRDLAVSHFSIGDMLRATGRLSEALESHGRALAIRQKLADDNPEVTEYRHDLAISHHDIGFLLNLTGKRPEALASYKKAVVVLQRLVDQDPSAPESRRDLALTYGNIGNLLTDTGKLSEALESQNHALAIRLKLADDNPQVTQYQIDLALSHHNIGYLLHMTGQPSEALASNEKALAIRQRLADDNPQITEYRTDLATSQSNLGALMSQAGNLSGALAYYQKALATRQKLADDEPQVTQYQIDLASIQNNLGTLLGATGRKSEALVAHRRALALRQRLADGNPGVTDFQNDLAASHNNIGVLFVESGNPSEALASYRRALAVWQKLADANPDAPVYRSVLGGVLNNTARIDMALGRWGEAYEQLTRAVQFQQAALRANPKNPNYRQFLAHHFANLWAACLALGRPAEAAAAAREFGKLSAGRPDERYRCAGFIARCVPRASDPAEARGYADEAMETLRSAVAAGYANGARMSQDADLVPLRGRDDFRRLVLGLMDRSMPADPFARGR